MTAEPVLPDISDSTFHMLRCVVAVAAADKFIRSQELLFLNNLLIHYRRRASVTAEHVAQLQADLKVQQPIDKLLARVTARPDREKLVLFAGLMAQSDGEVHPAEEELVRQIHAYCTQAAVANNEAIASAGSVAIPGFDMGAFKKEIRSIVQQEFYKHALATSGVTPHTGAVAVADAFTEPEGGRSRQVSYEMIVGDAGRHRAAGPALPKTDLSLKTCLRLVLVPAFLWLLSTQADMIFAGFTYHQLIALSHWGLSQQSYTRWFNILSSPLWGDLPSRFLRNWAGLLLLWRLYALWMSGRLSPLMRQSIVPGENILGKARFHFIFIAHPLLLAGILWILSYKANMLLAEQTYHLMMYLSDHDMTGHPWDMLFHFLSNPAWGTVPGQALRWLAWFIVLLRIVKAWMTEIVVTDSRLLFRQGILRVHTLKIDISNLRQVDVTQSALGLLLDFGAIHVFTNNWAGKGDQVESEGIYLPPVSDPHTFSTLVDRARRMWRKGHV